MIYDFLFYFTLSYWLSFIYLLLLLLLSLLLLKIPNMHILAKFLRILKKKRNEKGQL